MGCCASKKNPSSALPPLQPCNHDDESKTEKEEKESEEKLETGKKEVFLIHHRKSNDRRSEPKGSSPDSDGLVQSTNSSEPEISDPKSPASEAVASNIMAMAANGGIVRTSSCTKEEVDAILIQCGRLSRSSSGKGGVNYSGSKRSHDFDRENDGSAEINCDGGAVDGDERRRRRQSRGRRTPSRSRERDPLSQRSGSRERSNGGRRMSRSPRRRSENPATAPATGNGGAASSTGSAASNDASRVPMVPGKMVAVPPTVSTEKASNGSGRVPMKRNAMSPRSRSPVRSVQPSLSRSSSRKAEHSPYRRTPLNELDMNKANNSVNLVKAAAEAPPPLMRSRSSRRSRDLDINAEFSLNPKPAASYNSLILEDIHNFHQKTNGDTNHNVAESASTSVSKISSIVEGVADLSFGGSEYVTVRKRSSGVESSGGGEVCDEESSGSNSYPLGRASRDPNSADSTDRWTSRSREEGMSPVRFERHALSSNRGRGSSNRTQKWAGARQGRS